MGYKVIRQYILHDSSSNCQLETFIIFAKMVSNDANCNCIVTRGGVYDEILPEPEGFPEGSGNNSSYTLT